MAHLEPAQTKVRELLMNIFLICLTTSAIFLMIAYPLTRNKAYYVYSVLPQEWQENLTIFMFSYFVEICFILDTLLLMSVVQFLAYIYFITTNFWLNKIWYGAGHTTKFSIPACMDDL